MKEEDAARGKNHFVEARNISLLSDHTVLGWIFFGLAVFSLLQAWLVIWCSDLPVIVAAIAPFFGFSIFVFVLIRRETRFRNDYRRRYKSFLIPRFLKRVAPDVTYRSGGGIPLKTFRGLGLFLIPPTEYASSDLFSGTYCGVKIRFSFVHSQIPADLKGNTITQFAGVVMLLDFNKHFSGKVYLLPDRAESLAGEAGRKFQKLSQRKHTKLIRLDHPEFEKAFVVYAGDDTEARYILSPSFMDRLLHLRNRFGSGMRVAFRHHKMCLVIPTRKRPFDPSHRKQPGDEGQIATIKHRIQMLLDVVNDLDLSTRICTKD